jgi:histone acetyltransferase 1
MDVSHNALISSCLHVQVFAAELYNAIYNYVLSRPSLSELTVEDPAEAFEDLRDRNDLKMLLANEQFMQEGFGGEVVSHGGGKVRKPKSRARATPMGASSATVKGKGKMGPPVDKAWAEKWRTDLKIAGVSAERLI